jgi:NADH-quinone oxidoreductase subunit I
MLKRMRRQRKLYSLLGCVLCPVADITMKAEERKPDEKHLYREKYASIMKSICCVAFCGLYEEACPKDAIYLTISKELVPSSYNEKIYFFGKINW